MYAGIEFLTEFYLILGDVECGREVSEREGGHGEGSVRGRLFFLGSTATLASAGHPWLGMAETMSV